MTRFLIVLIDFWLLFDLSIAYRLLHKVPKIDPVKARQEFLQILAKNRHGNNQEVDQLLTLVSAYKKKASEKVLAANSGRVPITIVKKQLFKKPNNTLETSNPIAEQPNVDELNAPIADLLLEGDIVPTLELLEELEGRGARVKRQMISGDSRKWPIGVPIQFYFDASIPDEPTKNDVRAAFQYWEDHTCLDYEEGNTTFNRIRVYKGTGCHAYLGRVASWETQDYSHGDGCDFGVAVHEIGHSIGLFHQQSRYDRDNYVQVNPSNIQSASLDQYDKETETSSLNYDILYDYGSAMHYGDWSFANSPSTGPTMTALKPWYQKTMGSRGRASVEDLRLVNTHYGCFSACPENKLACKNGGFTNPKGCNKCICPEGFDGTLCDQRPVGTYAACTGSILAATTDWQTMKFSMSNVHECQWDSSYYPENCVWHITSPENTVIEVEIKNISSNSWVGGSCSSNSGHGIEIKFENLRLGGAKFCVTMDPYHEMNTTKVSYTLPVMKSTQNLVAVNLWNNYCQFDAYVNYRYVAADTTSTSTTTTTTNPLCNNPGTWSAFGPWSGCQHPNGTALTCGGMTCGVSKRTRTCDPPAGCPGPAMCTGNSEESQSCGFNTTCEFPMPVCCSGHRRSYQGGAYFCVPSV